MKTARLVSFTDITQKVGMHFLLSETVRSYHEALQYAAETLLEPKLKELGGALSPIVLDSCLDDDAFKKALAIIKPPSMKDEDVAFDQEWVVSLTSMNETVNRTLLAMH